MSEKSPYRESGLSARARPKASRLKQPEIGTSSGNNDKGLVRWGHDWDGAPTMTRDAGRRGFVGRAVYTRIRTCRICNQPEFAVEGTACAGRKVATHVP